MTTLAITEPDVSSQDEGQPPSERQRYLALLADLASLMQKHPWVPEPYVHSTSSVQFCIFSGDARQHAAELRRLIGGTWDKSPSGEGYFHFDGSWHGFTVTISVYREAVCRRVVTGEREVTETVKDPEALAAVPEIEVTRTETVYEWVCEPLLAPRTPEAAEAAADGEAAA